MTTLYSAAEAAAALGCSRSTVARWCGIAGIGLRIGGTLALSPRDVQRLRGLVRPGPGNPTFGTAAAPKGGRPRKKRLPAG